MFQLFGRKRVPRRSQNRPDDKVSTLKELGCTNDEAISLLTHFHGDVERAADYFLRTQHQEHIRVPSAHDPAYTVGDSAASVQCKANKSQTRGAAVASFRDTCASVFGHKHVIVKDSPVSDSTKQRASPKQEGMSNNRRKAATSNPDVSKESSVVGAIAMHSEYQQRATVMENRDSTLEVNSNGSEHSYEIPASPSPRGSQHPRNTASSTQTSTGPYTEVVQVRAYHENNWSSPSPVRAWRSHENNQSTTPRRDGTLEVQSNGSEHSYAIPASPSPRGSQHPRNTASSTQTSTGPYTEVVIVHEYHENDWSPPPPVRAWRSHENNQSTAPRTPSWIVETRPAPRPKSPPSWYQDTVVEPPSTTQSMSNYQRSTQVHDVEMHHDAIPIDETSTLLIPPAPTVAMLPASPSSAQVPTLPDREEAPMIWHCTTSQYSFEQGRSACTCIALCAATSFLRNPTMSSEFLEQMILDGVHKYLSISQSFPVEHLNVEEVLQVDANGERFPLQLFPGGIRQGVLSYDCDHPLGLRALLHGIHQEKEAMIPDQWLTLLLTKTPETVLVCLPPQCSKANTNDGDNNNGDHRNTNQAQQYYLIDSHPRPQQGVGTAYALVHSSLDSLVGSLEHIFPYTYMEPDTPEMMAMMYNSFDVYPLTIRPDTHPSK